MVLRVSRNDGDFAKDEAVGAVVGSTLPVPAVTARGETHRWAYAVSERLTGTPLDDLHANDLAAVLPDLSDVMTASSSTPKSARVGRAAARSWRSLLVRSRSEPPQ
jgi:hypothetical protein